MVSLSTWFRYVANKLEYSVSITSKVLEDYTKAQEAIAKDGVSLECFVQGYSLSYRQGQIAKTEYGDSIWKNLLQGRLTYLHWNKGGEEMTPTITEQGATLLVRKIPIPTPTHVFVGDVVLLRDPDKSDNFLVRRLAAIEGYEMVSTDEKDEPFVLEKDECWVLSDNEALKPKEAKDSRTYGPMNVTDIVGRVVYCLRTAVDHGPVENSLFGMRRDLPVMEVELDVDLMSRNQKEQL